MRTNASCECGVRGHTSFYDFSGGMESAAMLVVDRKRISETDAIVRWVNTGKQFDEAEESVRQIERLLDLRIVRVPLRITFDEFLNERGGMLRKGMTDCSRRMKRANLMAHARSVCDPRLEGHSGHKWEINLGYNSAEIDRAEDFIALNERPFCHWRFPLQEAEPRISRPDTWKICEKAGFSILIDGYVRMGRWDCFWCPNQTDEQAGRVGRYYPHLGREWIAAEKRKGHSFKPLPAGYYFEADSRGMTAEAVRSEREDGQRQLFACACFGGTESAWDE